MISHRHLLMLIAIALSHATPASFPVSRQQERTTQNSPRTGHAIGAYDATLGRVVLIGGPGDPREGERDTVWSWTGTQWDVVTTAGPESRVNAAAAYDTRQQRVIVVGGSRQDPKASWTVVGDSWASGRAGWERIANITPRDHHALIDDGHGLLMFGGIPSERSGPWPSDTSRLQTDKWSAVATDGPPARGRTALAYDSRRQQVVLFGGVSPPSGADQTQTFLGDTWIWNGERWRKAADQGPRGRYAHAMVFDERAGVVLLYSGAAAHRNASLTDMWKWDGERWTEITLTGPTPGYRYQPVMVYDRARGRTVLYGGIGGSTDTWEWDGQRWQLIAP